MSASCGYRDRKQKKSSHSSLGSPVLSWGHIQSHDSVPIHPLFSMGMNYSPALCSILFKALAASQCWCRRDDTHVDRIRSFLPPLTGQTMEWSQLCFIPGHGSCCLLFAGSPQLPGKREGLGLCIITARNLWDLCVYNTVVMSSKLWLCVHLLCTGMCIYVTVDSYNKQVLLLSPVKTLVSLE